MTGVQWIVAALGGFGGLAGIAALLNAVFGRGKTRAEAAQILTGTAVTMMNEFESDAKAAREEMKAVRAEARALADELHQLRTAIMQPTATIDGLRTMVLGGGTNGHRL